MGKEAGSGVSVLWKMSTEKYSNIQTQFIYDDQYF